MHLRTDTSSNSHFARVPKITHARNAFTVAKKHVTTIQFDNLYPLYWQYMYPGDTLSIRKQVMARLQTQIATLFDDLYVDMHAWFCPFRLIQTNWSRYQFNDQPVGPSQDNSSLTSPKITLTGLGAGGFAAKTFYDYLGLPTAVNFSGNTEHINNYVARAYHEIWNKNYRDQNLQNAVVVDYDDGPDDPADYATLLKRGKRHDKFTSALTSQQKGTAVTIPLAGFAPVSWTGTNPGLMRVAATGVVAGANTVQTNVSGQIANTGATIPFIYDPNGSLQANLALSSAVPVNSLRTSVALQHFLEADARSGTRDVESINARWGVTVPDYRMNRPEYLGGATFSFDGHVVPQTSATSGSNFQADLAQFSQAESGLNIDHSFVEHGVFLILISCRSNISYQNGIDRDLSMRTRLDWHQPEFSNLGEVAMLNKEIFAIGGNGVQDNQTWGFNEYGYQLRYQENMVTSEMRSNYAQSLDTYHMADEPSSLPSLGSAWIQSNTPISRNIAVDTATADPILLNTLASGRIARTLPMYSVPGLMRL